MVTLLSAFVGIVAGICVAFLIAWAANYGGLEWDFIVPVQAYVVAIVFSIVTGLLFGLYPARKAAKMDPIMALRK